MPMPGYCCSNGSLHEPDRSPSGTVLEYASGRYATTPSLVREAEQMITSGDRPRSIRKFFRHADEAVAYYIASMTRRYAADVVGDTCRMCGVRSQALVIAAWRISMPLKQGEFKWSTEAASGSFRTAHGCCAACYQHWEKRLRRNAAYRLLAELVLFVTICSMIYSAVAAIQRGHEGMFIGLVSVVTLTLAFGKILVSASLKSPTPVQIDVHRDNNP